MVQSQNAIPPNYIKINPLMKEHRNQMMTGQNIFNQSVKVTLQQFQLDDSMSFVNILLLVSKNNILAEPFM